MPGTAGGRWFCSSQSVTGRPLNDMFIVRAERNPESRLENKVKLKNKGWFGAEVPAEGKEKPTW